MKQTILSTASVFVLFFVSLFLYTKLAGPIPFSINGVTTTKTDTFTVTGTGKSTAQPDIAMVTLGVQTTGTSVKQTQESMNSSINKVTDAVKKLGIDAKDIKTTNYNVNPAYDYSGNTQRITGYQAATNITIKVRDIEKANSVIDAATKAGANSVGGVSFDIEDKSKAQNEARQKAADEAKKKATDAAKIAGFSLGRIINYQENFNGDIRPIPMMAAAKGGGESDTSTSIEPGSTDIEVTVSLSYEIK